MTRRGERLDEQVALAARSDCRSLRRQRHVAVVAAGQRDPGARPPWNVADANLNNDDEADNPKLHIVPTCNLQRRTGANARQSLLRQVADPAVTVRYGVRVCVSRCPGCGPEPAPAPLRIPLFRT